MNILKGRFLSRRAVLRGAGYTVGLPFLDVMAPARARAQGAQTPRFLAVFAPCGFLPSAWATVDSGPNFTMPAPMASLEPLRSHITLLSDMRRDLVTGLGTHEVPTGNFLTSAPIEAGASFGNNISIDQAIAATRTEPFRSLELNMARQISGVPSGYSLALLSGISYAAPNLLLPSENDPLLLLRRVFTAADSRESVERAERRKRRERSVLDGLLADAARLQGKLGAGDRARVDQHLTSLRELERQLELLEQESVYTAPDSPNITDIVSRVRAMSDVALAAIRCGRTRVLTLMLGNGASFQRYPFTTSGTTHHDLSHSPTEQGRLELAQIDPWMVEQFAYLLLGLQAIDDGNGMTALDNTFSMYGSELADGSAHTTTGYKIILGGRAGGRIAGNQHIVATGQPTANVLPTAGQMCGVPLTSFGDSTGPIAL